MSWKIFEGKELEGDNIGEETLFIEGCAPLRDVLECYALSTAHNVYFGARYKVCGMPSEIDYSIVEKFVRKGISVTIDGAAKDFAFLSFLNTAFKFNTLNGISHIICTVNYIALLSNLIEIMRYKEIIDKTWVKLLDSENKVVALFPLKHLQLPLRKDYEKDNLLAEGE